MKKKKLGVIIQYFNARKDVPMLLEALSKQWEIVLFSRENDLAKIDADFEKRPVATRKRTFWNRGIKFLYELAGNIPGSKTNFKFWNLRRIRQEKKWLSRLKLRILLWFRLTFSNLLSCDRYLELLSVERGTRVNDIDAFLGFTDVYDINFFAHLLQLDVPFHSYVYSWDHVAKYHKFSKRIGKYLTWHDGIKDDLVELHQIESDKIESVGSSQLAIVVDHLAPQPSINGPPFKYVYYAGTMGYEGIIKQEIRLVRFLAERMLSLMPDTKVVIRPYPNAKMFDTYQELNNLSNVVIDNMDFSGDRPRFLSDTLETKYSMITNADALIHMGSTIGLESAYFDTPLIQLVCEDFEFGCSSKSPIHIRYTLAQRHLRKYLIRNEYPNVVMECKDLDRVIGMIAEDDPLLMRYNDYLRGLCQLRSIDEVAESITRSFD